MRVPRGLVSWLALSGALACSTTTTSASSESVLRDPAQLRCEEIGMRACPELADGVVAFVDGDRPAAMNKITHAADQNSPDQLRELAARLQGLCALPGAGEYRMRVDELATILMAQSRAIPPGVGGPATNAPSPAPPPEAPAAAGADPVELAEAQRVRDRLLRVLTAPEDPARTVTETVLVSSIGKPCEPGGVRGICSARRPGPLLITDVVASGGCGDRLLVGAGVADTSILKWWVDARAPGIHGARLLVAAGEWVQVVQLHGGKPSNDQRCAITWSGYQPQPMPVVEPP